MNTDIHMRGLDFFNPAAHARKVDLIGVGGIGSFAALALTRLGITDFRLIDPDHVDTHNVGCQAYTTADIDSPKVDAITQHMRAINPDITVDPICSRIEDSTTRPNSLLICGLDSMSARKHVFETHVNGNPNVPWFIDARISGLLIHIHQFFPLSPTHCKTYDDVFLYDDAEADTASCTAQNIIDVAYQTSSLIAACVRTHLTDSHLSDPNGDHGNFITVNQNTLSTHINSYDTLV